MSHCTRKAERPVGLICEKSTRQVAEQRHRGFTKQAPNRISPNTSPWEGRESWSERRHTRSLDCFALIPLEASKWESMQPQSRSRSNNKQTSKKAVMEFANIRPQALRGRMKHRPGATWSPHQTEFARCPMKCTSGSFPAPVTSEIRETRTTCANHHLMPYCVEGKVGLDAGAGGCIINQTNRGAGENIRHTRGRRCGQHRIVGIPHAHLRSERSQRACH